MRLGFAQARGEVLMFLDADLTVSTEDLPRFYAALCTGKGEFINGVRLIYPMEEQAMRYINLLRRLLAHPLTREQDIDNPEVTHLRQVIIQQKPSWNVQQIQPLTPLRYLVLGGVSLRSLTPGWSTGLWRTVEQALTPWMDHVAMFAYIVLRRTEPRRPE